MKTRAEIVAPDLETCKIFEPFLTGSFETYESAVAFLNLKYGVATEPYYKELGYNKFKAGINKGLTNNSKVSRTKEGLYCHHVKESEYINVTSAFDVISQDVPHNVHLPENLVYCNLIEHFLLHVLIFRENEPYKGVGGIVGIGGARIMSGVFVDWFGKQPLELKAQWAINCREAALKDWRFKNIAPLILEMGELYKEKERAVDEVFKKYVGDDTQPKISGAELARKLLKAQKERGKI